MGFAVCNKTTNVGFFMMYIAACIINIITAVIFFGIVSNNIANCVSQSFIQCNYNELVLLCIEFIIGVFLLITLLQLIFSISIMLIIRKHENDVYITLKHLCSTNPYKMQDVVIKTYMNEPVKLVKARLVVEFLSMTDFWTSVIIFIISILDLAPTVTIKYLFFIFLSHTFIAPMGIAIGTGIESVAYIDWFVIINFAAFITQSVILSIIIYILQIECSQCIFVLYIIAWIEVVFCIFLTLINYVNIFSSSFVAELVFANIKSMKIDKKVRLGETVLEDSKKLEKSGYYIEKYKSVYHSFWFGR